MVFSALVGVVALARLTELAVSRRNLGRLRAAGGVEHGAGHYPAMVAVHVGLLLSCLAEVWLLDRPWLPWLAATCLTLLVAAMILRLWVIATLGERWVTRVMVVPGSVPLTGGPFRWLRHPNYVAVVIEIMALPLVHSAWLTAIVCSALNAAVLTVRVRVENQALGRTAAAWRRGPRGSEQARVEAP
jgi:methyltransferase